MRSKTYAILRIAIAYCRKSDGKYSRIVHETERTITNTKTLRRLS